MRCHYEVLSIEKDADDAEIKSAYKKLALKWHPDKNLDDGENAKEQFQLVQQAYEVLIDKQERAWYDRHREQILHGANSEFADNNLDVFQYFTTSCFKGYGDDENGFYTIYRKVFDQIAKEDLDFYEEKVEFCNIPSFGASTSDYDNSVHPFYAHWMSYSTKKSYVWLDPYNIKDIRDRRLLKAVEKENKKIRQKAKKERNEEIRNLVAFVRKRDKRVQAWNKLNEAKIEENRKKQDEIRKQKLEERRKLNESEVQAEWTKFENVSSELKEIEKNVTQEFGNSEVSDSDEENDLYCAACNKLFKTEKSFQNHESSKKHKENVVILKAQMLDEDEEYEDIGSEVEKESSVNEEIVEELNRELSSDRRGLSPGRVEGSSSEEIDVVNIPRRRKNKKSKLLVSNNHVSPDTDSEGICVHSNTKKPLRNKKSRNVLRVDSTDDELKLSTLPASTSSEDELLISKKGIKKKKGKAKKSVTESKPILVEDKVFVKDEAKEIGSYKVDNADNSEKKEVVLHICTTCKKDFPSKNKLFQHLKKEGHSVYLPTNSKVNSKTNKKK